MPYTKQTWETGDVVTAAKMNHIEDGIANAFLVPEPIAYNNVVSSEIILPETNTVSGYTLDVNSAVEDGDLLRVTYDGVEYYMKAVANPNFSNDPGVGYPGGTESGYTYYGDYFDVPFLMRFFNNPNSVYIESQDSSNEHLYKVERITTQETKLVDQHLLEPSVLNLVFNNDNCTRVWQHSGNQLYHHVYREVNGITFNDVQKAIAHGKNVNIVIHSFGHGYSKILYISSFDQEYGKPIIDAYDLNGVFGSSVPSLAPYIYNIIPEWTDGYDPEYSEHYTTPMHLRPLCYDRISEYE